MPYTPPPAAASGGSAVDVQSFSPSYGAGPITATLLGSGVRDTFSGTTAGVTASVAPAADRTVVLAVMLMGATSSNWVSAVITGLGLTWELRASVPLTNSPYGHLMVFTAYTGASAPTPGAITITLTNTGGTSASIPYHVIEVNGADPASPFGPVMTYAGQETTVSNPSFPLAPPAAGASRPLAIFAGSNWPVLAPRAGWTELAETASTSGVNMQSQFRPDTYDTAASATSGGTGYGVALGIELVPVRQSDFTWTKPDGASFVAVHTIDGGGGGASGMHSLNSDRRWGGTGGAAGAVTTALYPATEFGATEPVRAGFGGAGGVPQRYRLGVPHGPGHEGLAGEASWFSSPRLSPSSRAGGGLGGPALYVRRIAGSGASDATVKDGTGTAATMQTMKALCADAAGRNLYFVDGNRVRKMDLLTLAVSTIAGTASASSVDGTGTGAMFNLPYALCLSADGATLYVTEATKVRTVNLATAAVTTLAGTASSGSEDGPAATATFASPKGICAAPDGSALYVSAGTRLRKIDLDALTVSTVAGSASTGSADGTGTAATFNGLAGLCIDPAGTAVYLAETGGDRIRRYTIATAAVTTVAGSGTATRADGAGTSASFLNPQAITISPDGSTLYVDETTAVRKVVISSSPAVVTTPAYTSSSGSQDGVALPGFVSPFAQGYWGSTTWLAADPSGTCLYISDNSSAAIRRLNLTGAAPAPTGVPAQPSALLSFGGGNLDGAASGAYYVLPDTYPGSAGSAGTGSGPSAGGSGGGGANGAPGTSYPGGAGGATATLAAAAGGTGAGAAGAAGAAPSGRASGSGGGGGASGITAVNGGAGGAGSSPGGGGAGGGAGNLSAGYSGPGGPGGDGLVVVTSW